MQDKIVAFAGHRFEWHCRGVKEKIIPTLEELIHKGYTIFYDGGYGAFDKICSHAVLELKHKYPQIKLIKILAYYHHEKEKYELENSKHRILKDPRGIFYKNILQSIKNNKSFLTNYESHFESAKFKYALLKWEQSSTEDEDSNIK